MARIVLAADISGTRDGKAWPTRGSEVDLPDDEAAALVRGGAAVELDDPRVPHIRGHIFHDYELAGAPTGRDITEGQPDTHLARARFLAQKSGGDVEAVRAETRKAAENVNYTDAETVPQLAQGPLVGDGEPAPAQLPGAAEPNPTLATRDGQDTASGLVEAADAPVGDEERAVQRTTPRKR